MIKKDHLRNILLIFGFIIIANQSPALLFACIVIFILYYLVKDYKEKRQQNFIKKYVFPDFLYKKISTHYPHLNKTDITQVLEALRDYFHLCHMNKNNKKQAIVAMPSQVVDIAWHEFILSSKQYTFFCQKAFGTYLHHTPAEAMSTPTDATLAIQVAWLLSCELQGIAIKKPKKLPRLFAIDRKLGIHDGFYYLTNCEHNPDGRSFCASHISTVEPQTILERQNRGCNSGGGCGGGCGGG